MTRSELKTKARAQLGNQIFGNQWLTGLLVCLICTGLLELAGSLPTVGLIIIIVLSGPFGYGEAKFFIEQSKKSKKNNIKIIFDGFNDFGDTFLLGLMQFLYIFLWSLLFVIPGIVKAYAYSFAYYIKVDHPDYGWKQCIEESQKLTTGHKLDLFVLDLSFIGWYLLGALCLGVGTFWVAPYHNATKVQYYNSLK